MIPVSYLNTYIYCPRRFYLEHNRGIFEDNEHTVEGRSAHHAVDSGDSAGKSTKKEEVIHRRSVSFSSERLGLSGRLDLIEEKDESLYPVEYKKGKKPKNRDPWLNDQVQLCAQAMLMQDNGLPLPEKAYLYYIGSKARVEVPITEELIRQTERAAAECRLISQSDCLPNLTENRNKCFACSLNAVCLPEEEEVLKQRKINAKTILPSAMDGDILYVDTVGAYLGLSGGNLKISSPEGEEIGNVCIGNLREAVLSGPVQASTQAIHECLKNSIPVHYLNFQGRYLGSALPALNYHGILREAQWRAHFDPGHCLEIARVIVNAKLINMRTLMMRYLRDEKNSEDKENFERIKDLNKKVQDVRDMDSLRGYEGLGTKIYFSGFERYIKPEKRVFFYFRGRNRRPPKDPVNAMLGFGYSLLAKDCLATAARVGFDPYCGFYHSMKYGRPALALDTMEFFRQPVVDSVVITLINNGVLKENDFHQFQGVCYLNEKGRKKFFVQYEMRKKDMVTHPKFHYRLSYARTIELQLRLMGKYLLKDVDSYEGFFIR